MRTLLTEVVNSKNWQLENSEVIVEAKSKLQSEEEQ
jgi:hypothetical protein